MDEARIEPHLGMERLRADITRLIATLVAADWGFLG